MSVPVKLYPQRFYLLTLRYRTDKGIGEKGASIWLDSPGGIFGNGNHFLPPTDGAWRRVWIIDFQRNSNPYDMTVLARNFAAGNVWFDYIQVQEVEVFPKVLQMDHVEFPLLIEE